MVGAVMVALAFLMLAALWIRNEKVYNYRMCFIEWVYAQPDWNEKRKVLNDVSYFKMVWLFWRRLDSFGMYAGNEK